MSAARHERARVNGVVKPKPQSGRGVYAHLDRLINVVDSAGPAAAKGENDTRGGSNAVGEHKTMPRNNPQLLRFLAGLLCFDPNKRLTPIQALADPFLNEVLPFALSGFAPRKMATPALRVPIPRGISLSPAAIGSGSARSRPHISSEAVEGASIHKIPAHRLVDHGGKRGTGDSLASNGTLISLPSMRPNKFIAALSAATLAKLNQPGLSLQSHAASSPLLQAANDNGDLPVATRSPRLPYNDQVTQRPRSVLEEEAVVGAALFYEVTEKRPNGAVKHANGASSSVPPPPPHQSSFAQHSNPVAAAVPAADGTTARSDQWQHNRYLTPALLAKLNPEDMTETARSTSTSATDSQDGEAIAAEEMMSTNKEEPRALSSPMLSKRVAVARTEAACLLRPTDGRGTATATARIGRVKRSNTDYSNTGCVSGRNNAVLANVGSRATTSRQAAVESRKAMRRLREAANDL